MTTRGESRSAAASDPRQGAPGVRLLATECSGAAWAVEVDSVERIVRPSDWLDQQPLDVAQALELESPAGALERVLVMHGAPGAKALLSRGKLSVIELAASAVQVVPSIVYGGALGPVQSVVLEGSGFPVLICDPETLESALGDGRRFGK